MRLSREPTDVIRTAAREAFGADADVWLFGSGVGDSRRGGDIDPPPCLLERQRGKRKFDNVIETPDDADPIVRLAHQTGVRL
ncbi:MAG: hypothetical protein B7Y26_11630 [Hydrogenophilales bacterium 16-64-46]|nr:MAG: hypothetical protein B7Y26_11630 [Hydrogenophilales bacterium 16-64-46]OZA38261.1 MAG: hypothetical protein B7X87_07120 [Hydrogenophilales bacterium 17-64-34]HQS99165.1 hypothetical protein [Thiobacillus sp.]